MGWLEDEGRASRQESGEWGVVIIYQVPVIPQPKTRTHAEICCIV